MNTGLRNQINKFYIYLSLTRAPKIALQTSSKMLRPHFCPPLKLFGYLIKLQLGFVALKVQYFESFYCKRVIKINSINKNLKGATL